MISLDYVVVCKYGFIPSLFPVSMVFTIITLQCHPVMGCHLIGLNLVT